MLFHLFFIQQRAFKRLTAHFALPQKHTRTQGCHVRSTAQLDIEYRVRTKTKLPSLAESLTRPHITLSGQGPQISSWNTRGPGRGNVHARAIERKLSHIFQLRGLRRNNMWRRNREETNYP